MAHVEIILASKCNLYACGVILIQFNWDFSSKSFIQIYEDSLHYDLTLVLDSDNLVNYTNRFSDWSGVINAMLIGLVKNATAVASEVVKTAATAFGDVAVSTFKAFHQHTQRMKNT